MSKAMADALWAMNEAVDEMLTVKAKLGLKVVICDDDRKPKWVPARKLLKKNRITQTSQKSP